METPCRPGPRSIASYRSAIGTALQRGEKFEATLLLSELALQLGRGATSCDNVSAPSPCQGKDEINALRAEQAAKGPRKRLWGAREFILKQEKIIRKYESKSLYEPVE